MRPLHHRRARAFSLAECILALFVAALISFTVLGAASTTVDLDRKDRDLTFAANYCRFVMEGTIDAGSQPGGFGGVVSSPGYVPCNTDKDPGSPYSYVYRQTVTTTSPSLKFVSVTVYYRDPDNLTPNPDLSRPNGGTVVTLSTYLHG